MGPLATLVTAAGTARARAEEKSEGDVRETNLRGRKCHVKKSTEPLRTTQNLVCDAARKDWCDKADLR